MVSAFTNTFKIPELRPAYSLHARHDRHRPARARRSHAGRQSGGAARVVHKRPDREAGGGVAALFNLFSGGALENCAVFSLGIMPYISASIMMQLLTAVIPQLGKPSARRTAAARRSCSTRGTPRRPLRFPGLPARRNRFEHPETYQMLPGIGDTIRALGHPAGARSRAGASITITIITLTTGTMFLMWLGDQITERGIGNGISLIITVGIVARLPAALAQAWKTFVPSRPAAAARSIRSILVIMVAFLFIVIAGVIAITQAQRKITVQYAKRVVGRKMYGGGTQYMPLKVNYAGVMPIIFAQALLIFPSTIVKMAFQQSSDRRSNFRGALATAGLTTFSTAAMIFFFSYFWVATQFQPSRSPRPEEIRRLHPWRSPGQADGRFPRFHHDPADFCRRIFLTIIAVLPRCSAQPVGARPADYGAVLRRHQLAHHRGRHARHDAPGGDPPHPAPLRRLPA